MHDLKYYEVSHNTGHNCDLAFVSLACLFLCSSACISNDVTLSGKNKPLSSFPSHSKFFFVLYSDQASLFSLVCGTEAARIGSPRLAPLLSTTTSRKFG